MSKQIEEVMALVDEWGMTSYLCGEAELDAHHPEATQEEIDYAKDRSKKERAAWSAIEAKLRELLPVWQPIESAPKGFTHILVSSRDSVEKVYFDDDLGKWCQAWEGDEDFDDLFTPEYWMPLPKAPG